MESLVPCYAVFIIFVINRYKATYEICSIPISMIGIDRP